jgi:endonuclease/exonuclease/phosphatase family metal-dependent hydrolase
MKWRGKFGPTVGLSLAMMVLAGGCMETAMLPDDVFSVATYNINYGNPDLREVASVIRHANADVVALQETNRESERYLRRALGRLYRHMRFHTAGAAGGFGFLSKVPLSKPTYHKPTRDGYFGWYQVGVRLQGYDTLLTSIHLTPNLPGRDDSMVSFLLGCLKQEQVRLAEAKQIVATLSPDRPNLILGDCNSLPGMAAAKWFRKQGFADTYRQANAAGSNTPTWQWEVKGRMWQFRIDYIFASPLLATTLRTWIDPRHPSDHRLYLTYMRWNRPEPVPKVRPDSE